MRATPWTALHWRCGRHRRWWWPVSWRAPLLPRKRLPFEAIHVDHGPWMAAPDSAPLVGLGIPQCVLEHDFLRGRLPRELSHHLTVPYHPNPIRQVEQFGQLGADHQHTDPLRGDMANE